MSAEARRRAQPRTPALIGPHAVLHAVAVMEERLGAAETRAILEDAQIAVLPTGEAMIPDSRRCGCTAGWRCTIRQEPTRSPRRRGGAPPITSSPGAFRASRCACCAACRRCLLPRC